MRGGMELGLHIPPLHPLGTAGILAVLQGP